jgi:hypothetical protein
MDCSKWLAAGSVGLALGCSEGEPYPPGELELITGAESYTFSAEPTPQSFSVSREDDDGNVEEHATFEDPTERFSMGMEGVSRFEVDGFSAEGERCIWGRSHWLNTPTLTGYLLPLFVGRVGEFARPPGSLRWDHGQLPHAVMLGERYVLVAGAAEEGAVLTDAFDLGLWVPGVSPELWCPDEDEECHIRTLAVVDYAIVAAVGDGWFRSFVFSADSSVSGGLVVEYDDAALPDGLDEFSEVAGGRALTAPDGDVFIVGATRTEGATDALLRLLPSDDDVALTLRTIRILAPRVGAGAVWMDDYGLVVVGGSSDGPGVEMLPEGETESVALPYPPDGTRGAGLVALDADRVLRIGGANADGEPAPTVSIDLSCTEDCSPEPYSSTLPLTDITAYSLENGETLAVGADGVGETHVVRVSESDLQSISLRERRWGATSLLLATGHVAVVGGTDEDGNGVETLELYAR